MEEKDKIFHIKKMLQRIVNNLPEWADGKPIYLMANRELLAYSEAKTAHEGGEHVTKYDPVKVKTRRCEGCGVCCADCIFVQSDGCPFKEQIPFKCAVSDCSYIEECTEEFK